MTTAQYQSIAQLAADFNVPGVLARDAFGGLTRWTHSSFEGADLAAWIGANHGAANSIRVAVTPDAAISDAYVLALTASNPDTAHRFKAVPVTPGQWRLSGRLRQPRDQRLRAATALPGVARVRRVLPALYVTLPTSGGSWARFEQDFTVPRGHAVRLCGPDAHPRHEPFRHPPRRPRRPAAYP